MLYDARDMDRGLFTRTFDVCVVGSGPAGMTLARARLGPSPYERLAVLVEPDLPIVRLALRLADPRGAAPGAA
jgi:hypothetical protein